MLLSRIPPTTRNLLIGLFVISLLLLYFRLNSTPTPPPPLPLPSPTSTPPLPSLSPTPIASPSPTLTVINPQTGWHIFRDSFYPFTFEYPASEWNLTQLQSPQPAVLLGVGENQDAVALSFSLEAESLSLSDYSDASPSAWKYGDWQGSKKSFSQNSASITLITAQNLLSSGQTIYLTWARSALKGNPYTENTYLKPILDSFTPLP